MVAVLLSLTRWTIFFYIVILARPFGEKFLYILVLVPFPGINLHGAGVSFFFAVSWEAQTYAH